MEARLMTGLDAVREMQAVIAPDRMWPSDEFFEEKRKEQIADITATTTPPTTWSRTSKGSPGGLRDIQMIGWVAKRHFGVRHSMSSSSTSF